MLAGLGGSACAGVRAAGPAGGEPGQPGRAAAAPPRPRQPPRPRRRQPRLHQRPRPRPRNAAAARRNYRFMLVLNLTALFRVIFLRQPLRFAFGFGSYASPST